MLALKVAPSTAVVEKKHLKLTSRLQAHIREELYDTAEPNTTKLPFIFENKRDLYTSRVCYAAPDLSISVGSGFKYILIILIFLLL